MIENMMQVSDQVNQEGKQGGKQESKQGGKQESKQAYCKNTTN